jgi:DNA-directed RNA polymerase subunit beta'
MKIIDPQSLFELENTLLKLENFHATFDYLRICLASPKRIQSWAEKILPGGVKFGEVLRAETINFRTHQPENNGLFCERIFGPTKNWKCRCGKYSGFALNKICDNCFVEVIEARVRRYRMGYIELTCPITHLWYLKGSPNYLTILLRFYDPHLLTSQIEQLVYFREGARNISPEHVLYSFCYIDPIKKEDLQSQSKTSRKTEKIQKRRGSEIIKAALESIDIPYQIKHSRSLVDKFSLTNRNSSGQLNVIPNKNIVRQIRILESFLATKTNPSWMVLTMLPILPPNLRPLLELESGRLVAADINEIYRLLITRNQRLYEFIYTAMAPELVTIHSRKLLQEAVDSLIDNARLPKQKIISLNNKPLRSLTETLEGKQGRFRQSLLGKRVDYSGRSVIIVGPHLRLNQFGLPYEMALELFQPFLINQLLKTKIKPPSNNAKLAITIVKRNKPFIWTLLKKVASNYCLLLNRAPTLHRFGIQGFDPVIVLGQAIHLHPLVCNGFNADFDGDQMAVHLPLYESSQLEVRTMMRPSFNILAPSNGEVILKPTQDMVIGCYYLTLLISNYNSTVQKWFSNQNEALAAFYQKKISIHTPVLVRYTLLEFEFQIKEQKIFFSSKHLFFQTTKKEIFLYKFFPVTKKSASMDKDLDLDLNIRDLGDPGEGNIPKKYYLITNIGILIAYHKENNKYKLTDFFLETTPGRILFSLTFTNSIV